MVREDKETHLQGHHSAEPFQKGLLNDRKCVTESLAHFVMSWENQTWETRDLLLMRCSFGSAEAEGMDGQSRLQHH